MKTNLEIVHNHRQKNTILKIFLPCIKPIFSYKVSVVFVALHHNFFHTIVLLILWQLFWWGVIERRLLWCNKQSFTQNTLMNRKQEVNRLIWIWSIKREAFSHTKRYNLFNCFLRIKNIGYKIILVFRIFSFCLFWKH